MQKLRTQRVFSINALALTVVVLLWLALARALPTQAAGVVGNGQPGSCTAAALVTAMGGGGLVTFNCPPNTIILVTTAIDGIKPAPNTTIDGWNNGNPVTLSGNGTNRLFILDPNQAFTLTHITLQDGFTGYPRAGACLATYGSLLLDDVTVTRCIATDIYAWGGALWVDSGANATLRYTRVLSNAAGAGGGIYSRGTLTLLTSTVAYNRATTWDGGGLNVGGRVLIANSHIDYNKAGAGPYGARGGGIFITQTAQVSLLNSTVGMNGPAYEASALYGGGIFNYGIVSLNKSTLSANYGSTGAGMENFDGAATLDQSTVSGNMASGQGGGIRNVAGGWLMLSNSTLAGNVGVDGGAILNISTAFLTNTTIFSNAASQQGGGLYNDGFAMLNHVTLSGNSAASGGGVIQSTVCCTITLKNSIVANSRSGGNCFVWAGATGIASNGFNLSDDRSCQAYFNQPGDLLPETNPNLGPLANNGGPTLTLLPLPGSPAVDAIPNLTNGCGATITTDQRGAPRPINGKCDIGAVETGWLFRKLFLPLIVR